MTAHSDIAVAVLAAGRSERYGADKLMVPLGGIPLGLRIGNTLSTLDFGWRFAICGTGSSLRDPYSKLGFTVIENATPEDGQSHSLHLAVRAAQETAAKALLVVLGDMPFVTAEHLEEIGASHVLTASTTGSTPMPPALFPRALWPDLLGTNGDSGARQLLRQAHLVTASANELRDIDVPQDLPTSQLS